MNEGARRVSASRAHGSDQLFADERRGDGEGVAAAGAVGEEVGERGGGLGGAVPDPVVAEVAGAEVFAFAGDGVADHLLAGREAEGQGVEQGVAGVSREIGFGDEAAPGDVAGVGGFDGPGERGADGGADAVGADEEVGLVGGAVGEAEGDAVRGGVEVGEFGARCGSGRRGGLRGGGARGGPRRSCAGGIRRWRRWRRRGRRRSGDGP